ncbi:hypothetical protein ACP70R_005973 [Stipagrostis hirtigluma subsp. patula]
MSPAAGGAAPAQSAAPAAAAPIAPAAVEPGRAAAPGRDPRGLQDGADPANAARKTAWSVRAPPPAAAAAIPGGGIMGGDASWPALAESARAWPKSASSDSLKSLSDGSGPPAQEDPITSSVPSHPVVDANPIPTGSSPTSAPPPNATAVASSQQNGTTNQPSPVRRSGGSGGNNGGGSRANGNTGGRRVANSSGGDGGRGSGSGGDGNWNDGSLGGGSGCNSSYSDSNSSNGGGGNNLNGNAPGSGTVGNGSDSSRNALGNNNWNNNNIRGVGSSSSNGSSRADGNNRNGSGSSNHWTNNTRNGSSSSNGVGGRGGYRGRRDHERGGNFSTRNYPRVPVVPYQQQQQGVYQPGPFHRPPPPPPPPAHFMVPQHFVPYVQPFAYHGDVQSYPLYIPPVEQFQNMHLVRPPMQQPLWIPSQDQQNQNLQDQQNQNLQDQQNLEDQQNLQENIRAQIEFYFSTNNLCHDTYLRRHMDDQGWVSINLISGFRRVRQLAPSADTNFILDAIQGSEILEVQETVSEGAMIGQIGYFINAAHWQIRWRNGVACYL